MDHVQLSGCGVVAVRLTLSNMRVLSRPISLQEGLRGFYRGWAANALKVIPQNSIRFASYEALKTLFNV